MNAPIQLVAANAGVIFGRSTTLSGEPNEWALTFQVNVLGLFNTLRVFVPALLAQDAVATEATDQRHRTRRRVNACGRC